VDDDKAGKAQAAEKPTSRRADWRRWLTSPAVATLGFLLPAVVGYAIAQVDKGADLKFTTSDEFLAWTGSIVWGVTVWVAMSLGLLPTLQELSKLFDKEEPAIPIRGLFGLYAFYATLLLVILTRVEPTQKIVSILPLDHFTLRIRIFLAIGLAAAAPVVVIVWLVAERLRLLKALLEPPASPVDSGRHVKELQVLWRCSARSLLVASITVSVSVIQTAALRNALLAYDRNTWEQRFPASTLVFYGAFFTAAFAAVYVPALLAWRSRAQQLVDLLYQTPDNGKPDESWMKGRTLLEQLLGINTGAMASFSGLVAIFSPLATSLLTAFVPQLGNPQ